MSDEEQALLAAGYQAAKIINGVTEPIDLELGPEDVLDTRVIGDLCYYRRGTND